MKRLALILGCLFSFPAEAVVTSYNLVPSFDGSYNTAFEAGDKPAQPPEWLSTPSPSAIDGIASSYDVAADYATDLGVTLSDGAGCTLPTGVTVDNAGKELDFSTGTNAGTTPNCTLVIDDGVSDPVTSAAFSIVIAADPGVGVATIIQGGGGDFATIAAAEAAGITGIVELRASTPGGSWDIAEQWVTNASGTAGNEIEYRCRSGDTCTIYPNAAAGTALTITGTSYRKFRNINFGKTSDWSDNTWNTTRNVAKQFNITGGANHIDFIDCDFTGGNDYDGNTIAASASMIRFIGGSFELHGTNNGTGAKDFGDMIVIIGDQVIFDGVDLSRGGHNVFAWRGNYGIVKDSVVDQDFTAQTTGSPSARPAVFDGGEAAEAGSTPYGTFLIEGTVWKNVSASADQANQRVEKTNHRFGIERGNYYFDVTSGAIWLVSAPAGGAILRQNTNRFYNNTGFNIGGVVHFRDNADAPDGAPSTPTMYDNRWKNNIFGDILGVEQGTAKDISGNWNATQAVVALDPPAGGSLWRDNHWDSNIMYRATGADVTTRVQDGGTTTSTLIASATSSPDNFSNNTQTEPTFVAEGTAGNRTTGGFALSGGSAVGIGDAQSLTLANGAGVASTALVVDDPYYFFDGWDMEYFGSANPEGDSASPDCIKIGSGSPVRIAANGINYGTGAITLSAARSWSDNDAVFYVSRSNCSQVWDNRGASQ